MEYFTEEHAALMFGTEWLVKVDPDQSKSYLFVRQGSICVLVCISCVPVDIFVARNSPWIATANVA
jgi:hypothetical protein